MFKKVYGIILVLTMSMLLLLCSCVDEENDLAAELSPSDKNVVNLVSNTYKESELQKMIEFSGSIRELDAQYPIECLRKDGNSYRAAYLGDNCVAMLWFDDSGNKILGNIYRITCLKSDLVELMKNQSLEDVKAIDPEGDYMFLYTGSNNTPRASYHYTKDGYLFTVEYSESNVITSIKEELI